MNIKNLLKNKKGKNIHFRHNERGCGEAHPLCDMRQSRRRRYNRQADLKISSGENVWANETFVTSGISFVRSMVDCMVMQALPILKLSSGALQIVRSCMDVTVMVAVLPSSDIFRSYEVSAVLVIGLPPFVKSNETKRFAFGN